MPEVIDPKAAVEAAVQYFVDIMKKSDTKVSDARLEEINRTTESGKNFWLITISYMPETDRPNSLSALYGNKREYKVVSVNASDLSIQYMRIKEM
ncbi:MAG: hypothetical protein LBL08_01100 [Candidatus Nomurabacteria bacterium]|nr:hypothetical protein [Candidatus Nomurabacteria bacterium]